MNKEEFLRGLKTALSGELPPGALQSNLNYYEDYIRTEIGKGRSEAEVMEELGDPRLIARTIIDTTPGAGGEYDTGGYENGDSYGSGGGSGSYGGDYGGQRQGEFRQNGNIHYYDLNKWYWKLLGIVVVILVVTVVISVVSGILSLLVPLMPVIVMVMVIMWFVRGFKQ